MSQAGLLLVNTPVGAGVLTVQGDAGLPAGPDGLGNFLIVGAGGITTTSDPGTNTLTITNNAIAAQFDGDAGSAFPVGGILNIVGTANQLETAAIGNTVQISFTNDVIMPHDLTVNHDIEGHGDITSIGGLVSGLNVGAANAVAAPTLFASTRLEIANTGIERFFNLNQGVVQVDAAHELFSDKGNDGEFLIGSTAGVPAWSAIVSDGSIDITNGANSINLATANTVATVYYAMDGTFAVPALKRLNIYGGTNISTTAAGSTLSVRLNNSINLSGSIQAGTTISAGTGVTSTTGNITATAGSVVSNQVLTVQNGGMDVTGTPVLNSLNVGVAQINAAKQLIGVNSTADGQILIGSGTPGVLPVWNTLDAGVGIAIDNSVAGHISISSNAAMNCAFKATLSVPDAYNAVTGAAPYYYGQTAAMVEQFDPENVFYPGDGIVNPAQFVAPYDGIFSFTINCSVGASAVTATGYFAARFMHFDFYNVTAASYTRVSKYLGAFLGAPTSLYYANDQATQYLQLAAGTIIRFRHVTQLFAPATAASTRVINFGRDFQGNGTAFVAGFLVRRL